MMSDDTRNRVGGALPPLDTLALTTPASRSSISLPAPGRTAAGSGSYVKIMEANYNSAAALQRSTDRQAGSATHVPAAESTTLANVNIENSSDAYASARATASSSSDRTRTERRRRAASAPAFKRVSFAPGQSSITEPHNITSSDATRAPVSGNIFTSAHAAPGGRQEAAVPISGGGGVARKRAHSASSSDDVRSSGIASASSSSSSNGNSNGNSNNNTNSNSKSVISNHRELIDDACEDLDWGAVRALLGRLRYYKTESTTGPSGHSSSSSSSSSTRGRPSSSRSTATAATTRKHIISLSDVVTYPTCSSSSSSSAPAVQGAKISAVNASIGCIDRLPASVALPCTHLFLSNNDISCVLGIEQFQNVKVASLTNNVIRRTSDLAQLRSLRYLEKLNLEGNSVTSMPYYRQIVIALCPRLCLLDNVAVSPEERVHSDALSRRAGAVLESLRSDELRASVLRHVVRMTRVNTEVAAAVCGKFR